MEIDSPIANGSMSGNKNKDFNIPGASNGSVNGIKDEALQSPCATNGDVNGKKDLDLYPVGVNISGEGLPYAPINWPIAGDVCSWRTGRRVAASGHHLDRYLYLPSRFHSKRKKFGFASKQAVEQYVRSAFPDTDLKAFFKSFTWKIPCLLSDTTKDDNEDVPVNWEATESKMSDVDDSDSACKARNKLCTSLVSNNSSPQLMACDICCQEPGFCRDCCCILCCQAINPAHGGFSYFRCAALVTDAICGHVAHINCALRAHLAGTLGGTIGLDAEYYCRRCDSRSDLVPHVIKLLQTCKSIISREQIEEILGVGLCILRDSKRADAKQLLHNIQSALDKLKDGTDLEEVLKTDRVPVVTAVSFMMKEKMAGVSRQAKTNLEGSGSPTPTAASGSSTPNNPDTNSANQEGQPLIVNQPLPTKPAGATIEDIPEQEAPLENTNLVVNKSARTNSPSRKKRKASSSSGFSFKINDEDVEEFSQQMREIGDAYWNHFQRQKEAAAAVSEVASLRKMLKERDASISSAQSALSSLQQDFQKLQLEVPALRADNRKLADSVKCLTEERDEHLKKATEIKDSLEKTVNEMAVIHEQKIKAAVATYKASKTCSDEFGLISGPCIGYGYTLSYDEGKEHDHDLDKMPGKAYYKAGQEDEAERRFKEFAVNEDIISKYSSA